jgi:hypothetical protein
LSMASIASLENFCHCSMVGSGFLRWNFDIRDSRRAFTKQGETSFLTCCMAKWISSKCASFPSVAIGSCFSVDSLGEISFAILCFLRPTVLNRMLRSLSFGLLRRNVQVGDGRGFLRCAPFSAHGLTSKPAALARSRCRLSKDRKRFAPASIAAATCRVSAARLPIFSA